MTAPIGGFGGPGQGRRSATHRSRHRRRRRAVEALQQTTDGPSFGDTLKRALGEVSTSQETAQDYIQRFVNGEPVELHQVMAAAEEASISLEMLVELRNKLMDAYRTVVSMS